MIVDLTMEEIHAILDEMYSDLPSGAYLKEPNRSARIKLLRAEMGVDAHDPYKVCGQGT